MAPDYYQPPDSHDAHIRAMTRWLAIFFGTLAVAVVLAIVFAPRIAALLPFSVEKRFVRPYESMIGNWFGDLQGDPVAEAYLRDLAADLSVALKLPEDFEIEVHLVDDDGFNAFAVLGGHVFVLRGLVEKMPDENSLAMVLAHEIAHIKHRDPVVALGRGAALQLLVGFITGEVGSGRDVASIGSELGMLLFSRRQEEHADSAALHALDAHYGHVAGWDGFLAVFEDLAGEAPEPPAWLATHPDNEARMDSLRSQLEDAGYLEGEPVPIPEAVMKALAADNPVVVEPRPLSRRGPMATAEDSIPDID